MLLLHSVWIEIRDEFTADELRSLKAAAVGETICPRGLHIDTDELDSALAMKLATLVSQKGRGPSVTK
jgi:hypothetical protein